LDVQRTEYENDNLALAKIDLLELLDMVWSKNDFQFLEKFQSLKAFYNKYGHFNVPITESPYQNIGQWVQELRTKGTTPERTKQLNQIGFEWSTTTT
jgi:hypothetical protein